MDGEFGRLLGWVTELGLRALIGGLLLALPLTVLAAVGWLHRLPNLRAYWHVPIVVRPAVLAGMVFGWSVMYADPYGPSFRISSIFEVDGPWDVPWTTFLLYRADPAVYVYEPLLRVAEMPDANPFLALALLLIGCLLIVSAVAALVYLRGIDLMASVAGVPFIFLMSQALTIYVTALFAYTLNTLNFWAALVALVILQYYRRVASHGGH